MAFGLEMGWIKRPVPKPKIERVMATVEKLKRNAINFPPSAPEPETVQVQVPRVRHPEDRRLVPPMLGGHCEEKGMI